jgi:predicted transcriptional regulator
MKKRDRLEVIHDILKAIQDSGNSVRPTQLLRQSNLSSERFNEYVGELMQKGFVRDLSDKHEKRYFTLTDKGHLYLERYRALHAFIDEFDL